MTFVNDVAGVRDIPAWMKHMPSDRDGMTAVDVVFPAFLFIVGMAIPFAIQRRRDHGQTPARIVVHVAARTVALLVIGVFMVNVGGLNPEASGIDKATWTLLMFMGVILTWNAYPTGARRRASPALAFRLAGVALLVATAALYRGGTADHPTWMRTLWWGIPGLIGWAYLVASLVYLASSRNQSAVIGWIALLTAVNLGDRAGAFAFAAPLGDYVFVGGHIGGHAAITLAGVLLAMFLGDGTTPRVRTVFPILALAAGLGAAGFLLRPLYGVSKVAATPAWCLYSAALCCAAYVPLYLALDVFRFRRGVAFLSVIGGNALLAYILPTIVLAAMRRLDVMHVHERFNAGSTGIARAFVFTLGIAVLTWGLTRLRIRLRL